MPSKAPEGLRWCKTCDKYLPKDQFGKYLNAYCHDHWLVWNRAKNRAQYQKNHDRERARARQWVTDNPDKVRAYNLKVADRQRQLGWETSRKWLADHPERARQIWRDSGKQWRERYPEKAAAARHRKRARRAGSPGQHNGSELQELFRQFDGLCAYCKELATTWDHVVAMYRGGSNFIWNLVPSCLSCNSRKQDKDPLSFLASCQNCHPKAHTYVHGAVRQSATLTDPGKYIRNQYEKVSLQTIWDEINRIGQRDGKLTEDGFRGAKISIYTVRRRIGTLRQVQAMMGKNAT